MKIERIFAVAAAAGMILGLASCVSTPSSRIASHPDVFARLTPEEQAMVRQGRVGIGMDEGAVRLALGDPSRITLQTTAKGQSQVWHYLETVYYDGDFIYPGPFWYRRQPYWGGYWGPGPWEFAYPAAVYDRFRVVFRDGRVASIQEDMR